MPMGKGKSNDGREETWMNTLTRASSKCRSVNDEVDFYYFFFTFCLFSGCPSLGKNPGFFFPVWKVCFKLTDCIPSISGQHISLAVKTFHGFFCLFKSCAPARACSLHTPRAALTLLGFHSLRRCGLAPGKLLGSAIQLTPCFCYRLLACQPA